MITKSDNNVLTIFLDDRIDAQNTAQTERDLLSAVREGPDKDLVLDAEKLTYISSAGLRVLLSSQKIMSKKGGMKVVHVSDVIMEIFEVTGFSDILTIE